MDEETKKNQSVQDESVRETDREKQLLKHLEEKANNAWGWVSKPERRKEMIERQIKDDLKEEKQKQLRQKMYGKAAQEVRESYPRCENPDLLQPFIRKKMNEMIAEETNKNQTVEEDSSDALAILKKTIDLVDEDNNYCSQESVTHTSKTLEHHYSSTSKSTRDLKPKSSTNCTQNLQPKSSRNNTKKNDLQSSSNKNNQNDTITINHKSNNITIPKGFNQHIIITCNEDDNIKIQCKPKKNRKRKRGKTTKQNQGKKGGASHSVKNRSNVVSKCDVCERIMPSKPLLDYARKKNASQFNVIDIKNMKICPDCITTNVQQRRESSINATLLNVIQSAMNTVKFTWPKEVKSVNTQSATNLLSFLPNSMRCNSSFVSCTSNKRIAVLNVDLIIPQQEKKKYHQDIIGGKLPTSFEIEKVGYNTLTCPPNADYGIIKFNNTDDYLIIGQLESKFEDILEYGRKESTVIKKNVLSSRSGEASGLVYPDTNSKSLCDATKKKSSVLLQRKTSLGCSVHYDNNGEKKSYNCVYNQIRMQRLSARTKRLIVLYNQLQQRILLEEMKSRFTSLLVLETINCLPCDVTTRHIDKLKEVLEDEKTIEKFRRDGHSHFEAFLLAWGVSSGSMHNHEALCAHTDANKSHPVETLTLYPRLPDTDAIHKTQKSDLSPGYLIFPLYGFTIQMVCGYSVLHCSLSSTVHLPDRSRSMCNWSKVHGP